MAELTLALPVGLALVELLAVVLALPVGVASGLEVVVSAEGEVVQA